MDCQNENELAGEALGLADALWFIAHSMRLAGEADEAGQHAYLRGVGEVVVSLSDKAQRIGISLDQAAAEAAIQNQPSAEHESK